MKLAEAVLQEVVDFKVEENRFQVSLPQEVQHVCCHDGMITTVHV